MKVEIPFMAQHCAGRGPGQSLCTDTERQGSIQVKEPESCAGGGPGQAFCTGTLPLCEQTDTERQDPVQVKEPESCAGEGSGQAICTETLPSVNRQTQRGRALYRLINQSLV